MAKNKTMGGDQTSPTSKGGSGAERATMKSTDSSMKRTGLTTGGKYVPPTNVTK